MKETPLTHDIACNVGRAAQLELEGDFKTELRHLLFAAHDITRVLSRYRAERMLRPPTEWLDLDIAKRHANLLSRVSKRIEELIEQGA